MGVGARKSPVTCTLTALGAWKRKVTVLSSWISGEMICCPKQAIEAANPEIRIRAIFLIL